MDNKKLQKLLKRISENIKEHRVKSGFTQEDMANFGFDYRQYQRIESGEHNVTIKTLFRLAEAFKVDVSDLIKK